VFEYVKKHQPKKVMMVTECSMSDNVQVENPKVDFIKPCNLCPHMKKITLAKILDCLEKENNEVLIPNNLVEKARLSVKRMTSIGR
jgi:quinolinate synthase